MSSSFHEFIRNALPRGLALFLGGFSLLNIAGDFRSPGFDASLWWIDLRALPPMLAKPFLLLSAVCLIVFGWRLPSSVWRRFLTLGCVSVLGAVCAVNVVQFYALLARGKIGAGLPLPLSLLITVALALIFAAAARVALPAGGAGVSPAIKASRYGILQLGRHARPTPKLQVAAVFLACLVLFPLAQMFCFGKTDYRRPADVAIVLGARVYADGKPSDALADRVRTACQLYRNGLARKLVFSGGPGDGAIHETESMRRMAVRLGVKPEDILVDEGGLNTRATVKNSEPILEQLHASRVLVVSHFYHLPRIKLAYQRDGQEVYTVPAKESYLLRQLPYNLAREVAALWVYYLRPLVDR